MRTIATNNNVTAVKVNNSKSIMSKMRVLMLAVMAMLALGFASCSSSDDDTPGSGGSKATQVEATPVVYIAEEMLQYFDITYKANGETVQITKENTKATTVGDDEIKYNVLQYTGNSTKLTSFPSSTEASATVTLKDGVDLSKLEGKITYTLGVYVLAKNNAGKAINIGKMNINEHKYDVKKVVENGKESLFLKTVTATLSCPNAEIGNINTSTTK